MNTAAPEVNYLTDTAIEIGEEALCADMELFAEFVSEATPERAQSQSLGPISTPELVATVLLNPGATDVQLAQAARELRKRYVQANQATVLRAANRAMEA